MARGVARVGGASKRTEEEEEEERHKPCCDEPLPAFFESRKSLLAFGSSTIVLRVARGSCILVRANH